MTDSEITILRELRDSIRALDSNLSSRIDSTNEKVDATNAKVDRGFKKVDQLFAGIGLALMDVESQIRFLTGYLKNKTEVVVEDLRERVAKLEDKDG